MKTLLASIVILATPFAAFAGASSDLQINVNGPGVILATSIQSCTDLATPSNPPMVSLAAPAMTFGEFSIVWSSPTKQLFIGTVMIEVKSKNLVGGKINVSLSTEEVESLFGITNAVVPAAVYGPIMLSSRSMNKAPTSSGLQPQACGLGVSGLMLNATAREVFQAKVQIQVLGTATDMRTGKEEIVKKTLHTTAQYY